MPKRAGTPILFLVIVGTAGTIATVRTLIGTAEARALAVVEQHGGVYVRDESLKGHPVVRIDLQPWVVDDSGRIIRHDPAKDSSLAVVARFQELRELSLIDTRITDAGLVYLRGLSHLESLDLRGTHVTPAAIARLQRALPRLRVRGPSDS
jgi:hypothetical protein